MWPKKLGLCPGTRNKKMKKEENTGVGGHLLLCNQHLLRPIDDKVSTGVQRTLV